MDYKKLLHTLIHLKAKQIVYQVKYRLHKPSYQLLNAPVCQPLHFVPWIPKYLSSSKNNGVEHFCFINLNAPFMGWSDTSHGMLWAYNLNYMDWLGQEPMSVDAGCDWIDRFIQELPENKVGLDPYPIALRSLNWIKFISANEDKISNEKRIEWNNSLYSQVKLLENKLEYHLLGNHYLEDLYALFCSSLYFHEEQTLKKISNSLMKELEEEVLNDGMHYEQSPMYHCILLDRLLDCYNFSSNNLFFSFQQEVNRTLKTTAQLMLGHLQSMVFHDGTFPLFNDSALEIAPTAHQLFAYAKRLGIEFTTSPMKQCGYRKFEDQHIEALVDVGNITATYQPGHTHADTFNFALNMDGVPFIVDTGISTYNKTARRQYERSTAAHNTVTILQKDSAEVWGGFRVGKRPNVKMLLDQPNNIKATHDGFGKLGIHQRSFQLINGLFVVEDQVTTNVEAQSLIHLSPNVQVLDYGVDYVDTSLGLLSISGASNVEVVDALVSERYNEMLPTKKIVVSFTECLTISISKK